MSSMFINTYIIRPAQSSTVTNTGDYNVVYNDTTDFTVKGVIDTKTGRFFDNNNKLTIYAKHILYCEYNANILADSRVIDGSKTYKIVYIGNPNSLNHHLEIELELAE